MKGIYRYINTMYRPSFVTLIFGLSMISAGLCALAVTLRQEQLSGTRGISLIYSSMLEELIFPLILLLAVTLAVDAAEREKRKKRP